MHRFSTVGAGRSLGRVRGGRGETHQGGRRRRPQGAGDEGLESHNVRAREQGCLRK